MQLYCLAIETKNKEDKEKSEIIIDHFFADNKEQMEDRVVDIIKEIKTKEIETVKHNLFPVKKVDNIDFNKLLNLIYFKTPKKEK